jgi:hypothetical protein
MIANEFVQQRGHLVGTNRDELFREAGVPTSQPEPAEEELDMERIIGIFKKNGMRFLEDGGH